MSPPKQAPKRFRVCLHAVRAADDKDGAVEHLQRAFHLRGEVGVPRRVEQGHVQCADLKSGLLGKYGDAARAFEAVRVEKGVPVVDTAEPSYGTRFI